MPKTYKKKLFRKKKSAVKRRVKHASGPMVISRNPRCPIPDRAVVPFHINTVLTLAAGSVPVVGPPTYPISFNFQANKVYRPFGSAVFKENAGLFTFQTGYATTDSPNAFLNWCSTGGLYLQYRCLHTKITVRLHGVDNSGAQGLRCAITPVVEFDQYNVYRTAAQSARAKVCESFVYKPNVLSHALSTAKHYSANPAAVRDSDFYAGFTSPAGTWTSPSNETNWIICLETTNKAATAQATEIAIEVEFLVQLESPNYVQTTD